MWVSLDRPLVRGTPYPCLCSHDRGEHDEPEPVAPGLGLPAARCQRPGCGCLRYRPDLTKDLE